LTFLHENKWANEKDQEKSVRSFLSVNAVMEQAVKAMGWSVKSAKEQVSPTKGEGMKKWTVESAKALVLRTGGMVAGKQVWHSRPGIKVLGTIDYLIKKEGFVRVREL